MHTEQWVIVGAGGHARVVMDALFGFIGIDSSVAFADDDASLHGRLMLGRPVLGAPSDTVFPGTRFHIAVGSNSTRKQLYLQMLSTQGLPFTVVHSHASVSRHAKLDEACFVGARSVVAPGAILGVGVIINHGAVVDHDCQVGDFAHIAPGATLAGGVRVGSGVLVGAGANLLPGVAIGHGAVVGAGAVVTENVPPEAMVVGIPARAVKRDMS